MGNIVLLDDLTINKIAAGEVIERLNRCWCNKNNC